MKVSVSEIDCGLWAVIKVPDGYDDQYCIEMDEATYQNHVGAVERYELAQAELADIARARDAKIEVDIKKKRAAALIEEANALLREVGKK